MTAETAIFSRMSRKQLDQHNEQEALLARGLCPVNDRDRSTPRVDAIAAGRNWRSFGVTKAIAAEAGMDFEDVRGMGREQREALLKYGY